MTTPSSAASERRPARYTGSKLLRALVCISAAITVLILASLVVYILIKGVPNLKPGLFARKYTSDNCSMLPAILNTVTVTLTSLLFAVPLGVGSAIYLAEYAKRGSRLVRLVRLTTETLAGIPSIVYGLFGYLMFTIALKFGYSLLSGILTLSIMVLPTIMRTTEEALTAVPDLYREGSFGLGAGRLRTVWRIVLPSAMPGIASGVILAIGRIVGETAALIFTSGTDTGVAGLTSSGRTLAIHMYALWNEGLHMEAAYATGVVLLILVVGINALASYAAKKVER
ncbi:phosphate ABC transporter permease PstA [Oscillibacter hominis]|uniref:Phosphate transport system permease protein PstA n=1 Tax=Oscillibacter hominis TaxID=2763056 RepID=A0A7G9B5H1_9FIRM|nr:phosphate ABC transporter permease PstA [Oscillibacter hominis]QNL44802.1 phosphate ABC transporter permease PstA [Oscillibacter hominis]